MNFSLFDNLTKPLCKCKDRKVDINIAQIILGAGAFVLNLAIVIAIGRYKALRKRKEYVIVAGLALADSLEGFATMFAGVWRTHGILTGWSCICISKVFCMATPQSLLWRWTEFATAFMLLAVSVDRLIAVTKPLSYFTYRRSYAVKMVALVYLYATLNLIISWYYPIMHRNDYMTAYCSSSSTVAKLYYQYSKYTSSFGSCMSVIVFGAVVIKFFMYQKSRVEQAKGKQAEAQKEKQAKAQQQLTITLAISSACTLLLDSIPRAWGIYIEFNKDANIFGSYKGYVFQMTKVNAMANFFIYAFRQKDIKMALFALFSCKKMPADVTMWESTHANTAGQKSAQPERSNLSAHQ